MLAEKARQQKAQEIHEQRQVSLDTLLQKDDLVMIRRPHLSDLNPAWRKLKREWIGPLRITGVLVLGKDKFLVSDWTGKVIPVVAQRRELKPYHLRQLGNTEREIVQAVRDGATVIHMIREAQAEERRKTTTT